MTQHGCRSPDRHRCYDLRIYGYYPATLSIDTTEGCLCSCHDEDDDDDE